MESQRITSPKVSRTIEVAKKKPDDTTPSITELLQQSKDPAVQRKEEISVLMDKVKCCIVQRAEKYDFEQDSNAAYECYCQMYENVKQIIDTVISSFGSNISNPNLWRKIGEKIKETTNIDRIIGKCTSMSTGAFITKKEGGNRSFEFAYNTCSNVRGSKYQESIMNVIQNLELPIRQTLSDIYYWGINNQPPALDVVSIDLTDSDMHVRGVGVCIVEYQTSAASIKRVIKPEDKTFEATLYGKGYSVANDFNNKVLGVGAIASQSGIGLLDIQTSDGYGSSVEFYEHERYEGNVNGRYFENKDAGTQTPVDTSTVNVASYVNTLIFSSLLGLADLHRENLVFGKDTLGKRIAQFIDAEIGFKYKLPDVRQPWKGVNPLTAAFNSGEFIDLSLNNSQAKRGKQLTKKMITEQLRIRKEELLTQIINFLDKDARAKFSDKRSRIVPLATGEFYALRRAAYVEGSEVNKDNFKKKYVQALAKGSIFMKRGTDNIKNIDIISEKTYQDLLLGRIPFYEYDFMWGTYIQKFSDGSEFTIYANPKLCLDNIIDNNIKMLKFYFYSCCAFGDPSL